ncbi:FAD-dependent oxidoreductase, partial [Arthrobacter sp. H14]|uniref:FAD-dependent oxidoreductase n=1 Tax=Arthrobacter sp. H14 TaxID=1312959 RepID=UPI00138ABC58
GQAFARLGSAVVLVARSEILPREDRDAASVIRDSLEADGVNVIENAGVDHVSANEDGTAVVHTDDGQSFDADVILAATGRSARTESLGLDALDVECAKSGHVLVDAGMRTSNPAVWAAGDVTPYPHFTHLAGVYASVAASNAVLGLRRTVNETIPRVTYTSPEVAAVGLTDATAPGHTTSTIHHGDTDRAVTEQQTSGMTRSPWAHDINNSPWRH